MRILFVGMPDSIHTARWISQITDQGWEIYLFPTYLVGPHPMLQHITFLGTSFLRAKNHSKTVRFIHWPSLFFARNYLESQLIHTKALKYKEQALKYVMQNLRPDIIHSLELQQAGYITLGARKSLRGKFPAWIATNWGSDIYLFGRLAEHQEPIRQVLQNCDYYSCECQRDVELARKMGFQGTILPVLPNTGGIHFEQTLSFRQPGPVSQRKAIILKGYQHWAGRALVAFQAFRFCLEALEGYAILIYSASEDVKIAAQLFAQDTGLQVELVPDSTHENILSMFGKARIYIGLSISDGISTSLLEAMTLGAFPIQSCTACADEWFESGQGGFIVPPEDPQEIANAIRRALSEDVLVDRAAEINSQTIKKRLDYSVIKSEVVKMYQSIYTQRKL
ncbi:MAG TPA: glycosyltransferase [Anaerolineaceae bacterium]|nr:glycosyltransferase [Anaerolineaceae bacterium]